MILFPAKRYRLNAASRVGSRRLARDAVCSVTPMPLPALSARAG
jgi:hypothetical protein